LSFGIRKCTRKGIHGQLRSLSLPLLSLSRTHTHKSYDFCPEIPVQTKHREMDIVIIGKLISNAPFLRTYSHVSVCAIVNLCRNVDLFLNDEFPLHKSINVKKQCPKYSASSTEVMALLDTDNYSNV
jgi:hypothetical protein